MSPNVVQVLRHICLLLKTSQKMTIRVERILTSVVDQALERTLVVKFLPEDEDEAGCSVDDNDAFRCLIQACGGGCF